MREDTYIQIETAMKRLPLQFRREWLWENWLLKGLQSTGRPVKPVMKRERRSHTKS